MKFDRDQRFSGAGFARNQDGPISRRDDLDLLDDLSPSSALTKNFAERCFGRSKTDVLRSESLCPRFFFTWLRKDSGIEFVIKGTHGVHAMFLLVLFKGVIRAAYQHVKRRDGAYAAELPTAVHAFS